MGPSVSQPSLFSLLPPKKTPWREFVFSYGTLSLLVTFFCWVGVLHPEVIPSSERTFRSVELVPTPVPVNHQPQPVRILQKVAVVAELDPPAEALRLPAPTPKPKVVEDTPAPEVRVATKKLESLPTSAPVIPRTIKTNVFSTGSSATPTTARAPEKVQTGGFGDPNGIPAKDNPGRPVNIAQLGSFDLPSGPGYGNGTSGANGARGVVVSTGFGNGVATGNGSRVSSVRGTVHQGGFGDADVPAPPTVHSRPAEAAAAKMLPAEILSKPVPIYTEEARHLRVEGEVLLEVVLEASGKVHVVRVVRGLGHGLDDEAIRNATQIRFKPALRDGQPSDSTVVVHIVFQLA